MGSGTEIRNLLRRHVLFNGDLNRIIACLHTDMDCFDDLDASPQDCSWASALESRTREAISDPVIEEPFVNGVALTWPFLPNHWHATRYSDGTRFGVWYGSPDLQTSAHESTYHWLHFVTDSYAGQSEEIVAERKISLVRCQAELADLRDQVETFPFLITPRIHRENHRLGKLAHRQGEQGLLVPSVRHRSGFNTAIFRQSALSRPRECGYLTYRWNPLTDAVTIEHDSGRTWLRLKASELLHA